MHRPRYALASLLLLGVDALLFGRITDFREPREVLTQADVVDTHQDPIYVRRTRHIQNPDGTAGTMEETVISGYRTTRVVRRLDPEGRQEDLAHPTQ